MFTVNSNQGAVILFGPTIDRGVYGNGKEMAYASIEVECENDKARFTKPTAHSKYRALTEDLVFETESPYCVCV